MVGSLDLARLPLGIAQREAWRATRSGFAEPSFFSQQLLAVKLQTVPLPLPQLTTLIFFSLWSEEADLERFRKTSLRRWQRAGQHLNLTLCPVQSFGSWRGIDPISGCRSEPGPGPTLLITHSRTRLLSMPRFLFADRPVVRSLKDTEGHLWAGGFVDRLQSGDSGTLSLWRSTEDALSFAYTPGVHRRAVAAQEKSGWFAESWFARFAVTEADGRWPGLDRGNCADASAKAVAPSILSPLEILARHDRPDKGALGLGISVAFIAIARRELVLQIGIPNGDLRIGAKTIAKASSSRKRAELAGTRCRWWVRRAGSGLQNQCISSGRYGAYR